MRILEHILLICLVKGVISAQNIGDPCENSNSIKGTCQYVTECPSTLLYLQTGIYPAECERKGNKVVICCTDPSSVIKNPASFAEYTAFSSQHRTTRQASDVWIWETTASIPGDISKEKCKEYAEYAYTEGASSDEREEECPFHREELIVGGVKCHTNEFPHMAHLGYGPENDLTWNCAGSIISPSYILTAAHCIGSRSVGSPTFVRVGVTNQNEEHARQTIKVASSIKHPDYVSKYHDIGLIKLEKEITFEVSARPACLYTNSKISGKMAYATGWGDTEYGGEQSENLMKVLLEKFTPEKCNKTYRREIKLGALAKGIVDDYMICYGSETMLRDTCQGDSGGPLQIYHPEEDGIECMYQIIGVTSFGKACGLAESVPGVYTRVSNYIEWIEKIVWP